jgi:hypothetical protein
VFALYGDPRLPAEYVGTEASDVSGRVLARVAELYPELTAEAGAILDPFLRPPADPASWYALRAGAAASSLPGAVTRASINWTYSDCAAPVRIQWDPFGPDRLLLAADLCTAVETKIWPGLKSLFGGVEPLSDAGVTSRYNGGDGSLDVYLVDTIAGGASGVTTPYKGAEATPAFIELVVQGHPLGDETTPGLVQTLAHEMMHAWQLRYDLHDPPSTYDWLTEATAVWVEDYLYKLANSEHRAAAVYLNTLPRTLSDRFNNRDYGAYLLFQYLVDRWGSKVVFDTFENASGFFGVDSLRAIDKAIPDGDISDPTGSKRPHWFNDFAVAAWNHSSDAYGLDYFHALDKLEDGAKPTGGVKAVNLYGSKDTEYSLIATLPALSARYYHFTFPDPAVRTVIFYDGVLQRLEKKVWNGDVQSGFTRYESSQIAYDRAPDAQVLVKIGGKWKRSYWPTSSTWLPYTKTFCRDLASERIEELVVIYSNGSPDPKHIVQQVVKQPRLFASNYACGGWDGTASAISGTESVIEQTTVQASFRRYQGSFWDFRPISGQAQWTISGDDGTCSYSGTAAWPVDPAAELFTFSDHLAGPAYRGFGGSIDGGGGTVEYLMTCRAPYESRSGTYQKTVGVSILFPYEDGMDPLAKVSEDGLTLTGSYSPSLDPGSYSWSFAAYQEP